MKHDSIIILVTTFGKNLTYKVKFLQRVPRHDLFFSFIRNLTFMKDKISKWVKVNTIAV